MSKTLRQQALASAQKYVGVKEHPPGSNRGPHIDKWNLDACGVTGVYWCCSFVHGMYLEHGYTLPGGASVGNLLAAARRNGWVVARPLKADLACFEFGEGVWADDDHIGVVEKVLAVRWRNGKFTGWIRTVEGNTSAQNDASGSQSNGGGVFRRWRWLRNIDAAFVRVPGRGSA